MLDENALQDFLKIHEAKNLEYTLYLDEKPYLVSDVSIAKSSNPVNSPTLRGGVYITDKFDYKISCAVSDISIAPLLSRVMLGPNTDFTELKLETRFNDGKQMKRWSIFAYLTSSVQNSSQINLNLSITRLETDQDTL